MDANRIFERSRQSSRTMCLATREKPSSRPSSSQCLCSNCCQSRHRWCIRHKPLPSQTNLLLISIQHQDPATVPQSAWPTLAICHSLTHFNQHHPTRSLSPTQTPLHREHGCLHHPQRPGSDPHRHGLACPRRRARSLVRCDRSGVRCDEHGVRCRGSRRVARRGARRKPSGSA